MRRVRHSLPISYERADGLVRRGVVRSAASDGVELAGPALSPGDVALIEATGGSHAVAVQVARVQIDSARCTPLDDVNGVRVGDGFACVNGMLGAYVGDALLGRVLDGWGRSVDGSALSGTTIARVPVHPLPSLARAPIRRIMRTGVGALDAFVPVGYGQRVSLTAGAGVGKTTLVRRIVEGADVDARVVALVGERGREIEEATRRLRALPSWPTTTLYCTPPDSRPLERYGAARSATMQAEWLCRDGRRVLLVIDSLTRVASAWREIALANGEPPAARGHPPSLHAALASLVERAGARRDGSITAIYTVLAEGDDQLEPVADTVRAMLDGHVALSRRHADAGRYPAIDVLRSLSRTMAVIAASEQRDDAALVRHALSTLEDAADLVAIGAYRAGSDAWLDACMAARAKIEALVFDDGRGYDDPITRLADVAAELRRAPGRPAAPA